MWIFSSMGKWVAVPGIFICCISEQVQFLKETLVWMLILPETVGFTTAERV